jgi:hypothetical protein
VNVFFDNCTSPVFAATLDGFVRSFGHRAYHIKDVPGLKNGRHATDLEWISHLQADNKHWIFISGDGRILKNRAERAALRSAGLHGFVLAPAYQLVAAQPSSCNHCLEMARNRGRNQSGSRSINA